MRKTGLYIIMYGFMTSCQHELHFPEMPVVVVPHEKVISAVVVTNPAQSDYDSIVFRYGADKTAEVHYTSLSLKDSVTRTYYYDNAGRLSMLEDGNAIFHTNNNKARRIRFEYNASGQLKQTTTDFTDVRDIKAAVITGNTANGQQVIVFDTSYSTATYNLGWTNRIIYSTISNNQYLLYDSAIFLNTSTAGLFKTMVNEYRYGADSTVTAINRRIYFNSQLSEYGLVSASSDQPAPVFLNLRKKLYRNLANWFETSMAWQDDNYRLFPLPGGPYRSILYKATSLSAGAGQPPYTRDYKYDNTYSGDQLNKSVIDYTLLGQGTSRYTTILRFYYRE